MRTTGNWRQHYIGRIIEPSGNRAIRLVGEIRRYRGRKPGMECPAEILTILLGADERR